MGWVSESFNRTVKTREDIQLQPGETSQMRGVRLKPGDLTQVYRGRGQDILASFDSDVSVNARTHPGSIHYLNFEGGRDFVMWVGVDRDAWESLSDDDEVTGQLRVRFYDIDNDSVGNSTMLAPSEGLKTYEWGIHVYRSESVHRGNEYFIGSAWGNWVVTAPDDLTSDPNLREMGMSPAGEWYQVQDSPDVVDAKYGPNPDIGSELQEWVETWYEDLEPAQRDLVAEKLPPPLNLWTWSRIVKAGFGPILHHVFVYWYTEYDSTNDIESRASTPVKILAMNPSTFSSTHPGRDIDDARNNFKVELTFDTRTQVNSNADQIRVYRSYVGESAKWYSYNADGEPTQLQIAEEANEATQAADEMVSGSRGLVGGLIQTVDISDAVDSVLTVEDYHFRDGWVDSPISYPLVSSVNRGVVKLDPFLEKPNPWVAGGMFSDSLVVGDFTNRQTAYYTFPGDIEYQPRTAYRELVISERGDGIRAVAQVRNNAVLLTESGVLRFNYLAFEGETYRDEQQTWVSGRNGVAGFDLMDKIELPDSEWMIWLSREAMFGTNGFNWRDMCPDWRVSDAIDSDVDLSTCTLINDPRDFRLMLYVPDESSGLTLRWDFYYHPTQLTDEGLRCVGPHIVNGLVRGATRGSKDSADRIFLLMEVGGTAQLWIEGEGWEPQAQIVMRRFRAKSPSTRLQVQGWAIDHTTTDGLRIILTPESWNPQTGRMTNQPGQITPSNGARWTYDLLKDLLGHEMRMTISVTAPSDSGDWAIGPLHLDMEGHSAGIR